MTSEHREAVEAAGLEVADMIERHLKSSKMIWGLGRDLPDDWMSELRSITVAALESEMPKLLAALHAKAEDEGVTQADRDPIAEQLDDDIADALHLLHWEAWKAGIFSFQEQWPDDDDQCNLVRSIDSVAVGEHYEAWAPEIVAALKKAFEVARHRLEATRIAVSRERV
jgi:hypothetical protein